MDLEGLICEFLLVIDRSAPLLTDLKTVPRGLGAYRGVANHVTCRLTRDPGPFGPVFFSRLKPFILSLDHRLYTGTRRTPGKFAIHRIPSQPFLSILCLSSPSLVLKTSRLQRRNLESLGEHKGT